MSMLDLALMISIQDVKLPLSTEARAQTESSFQRLGRVLCLHLTSALGSSLLPFFWPFVSHVRSGYKYILTLSCLSFIPILLSLHHPHNIVIMHLAALPLAAFFAIALAQTNENPFNIPKGFALTAGKPTTLTWKPTTPGTVTLRSGIPE